MVYYSIPGSTFKFTPAGQPPSILQSVEFDHAGCLDVEELQKLGLLSEADAAVLNTEMQAIANRPGSGVRTDSAADVEAQVKDRMAADMRAAAEAAHRKMIAAGEKVT